LITKGYFSNHDADCQRSDTDVEKYGIFDVTSENVCFREDNICSTEQGYDDWKAMVGSTIEAVAAVLELIRRCLPCTDSVSSEAAAGAE